MYFQEIITTLQKFWSDQGCVILQSYDIEVGAGTSHPMTGLRCVDSAPWNVCYVQPCRRPSDGRYGENPNRMQHYYQFQVIMKPSPDDIQDIAIASLQMLNIETNVHDIRFVEDDWENPTMGAWGLGWEVWCDGMEVMQYTYIQQLGSIECRPVPCEITYGLERLAMYIQGIDNVWDLKWNKSTKYRDVFLESEKQYCDYNFDLANVVMLKKHFEDYIAEIPRLIEQNAIHPAYDYCLKICHIFNILEARNVMGVTERTMYMKCIRDLSRQCCQAWYEKVTPSS